MEPFKRNPIIDAQTSAKQGFETPRVLTKEIKNTHSGPFNFRQNRNNPARRVSFGLAGKNNPFGYVLTPEERQADLIALNRHRMVKPQNRRK